MKLLQVLLFCTLPFLVSGQTLKLGDGIQVIHFNAG
jgi:hypothetical protein